MAFNHLSKFECCPDIEAVQDFKVEFRVRFSGTFNTFGADVSPDNFLTMRGNQGSRRSPLTPDFQYNVVGIYPDRDCLSVLSNPACCNEIGLSLEYLIMGRHKRLSLTLSESVLRNFARLTD